MCKKKSSLYALLGLLCVCRNSWPKMARLLFRTLFTLQIWHPATFFLSANQVGTEGRRFDDIVTILKQSPATHAEFKTPALCKCFQQWRHCVKSQGKLFRRGQHGIGGKCHYFREKKGEPFFSHFLYVGKTWES